MEISQLLNRTMWEIREAVLEANSAMRDDYFETHEDRVVALQNEIHYFNPDITVLGMGMCRIVVTHRRYKNFVFKVQYGTGYRTFGGNLREWDRYFDLPRGFKKFFAKPIAITHNCDVLVMELVKGDLWEHMDDFDYCDGQIENMVEKFNNHKNAGFRLRDIHERNVIFQDEHTFKVIDYAG